MQIKLELDQLPGTERIGFGAHPGNAIAQPSLQRSDRLPFEPIQRVAIGMALRNDAAA